MAWCRQQVLTGTTPSTFMGRAGHARYAGAPVMASPGRPRPVGPDDAARGSVSYCSCTRSHSCAKSCRTSSLSGLMRRLLALRALITQCCPRPQAPQAPVPAAPGSCCPPGAAASRPRSHRPRHREPGGWPGQTPGTRLVPDSERRPPSLGSDARPTARLRTAGRKAPGPRAGMRLVRASRLLGSSSRSVFLRRAVAFVLALPSLLEWPGIHCPRLPYLLIGQRVPPVTADPQRALGHFLRAAHFFRGARFGLSPTRSTTMVMSSMRLPAVNSSSLRRISASN